MNHHCRIFGEQPIILTLGHIDLIKDAVPENNPPPPIDMIITSNSSDCEIISVPRVPCPAITSKSLYGEIYGIALLLRELSSLYFSIDTILAKNSNVSSITFHFG